MSKKQIRNYVFSPGVAGSGNLKILDKIKKNQILMITNVTRNKILYNFADPTNPVIVEFTPGNSTEFPYASSISNGVTTIHFSFDTSDQLSTDEITIFIESEDIKFRPYNFGTDAVERMRVATPQSMIDADFEYGIQPTKWQTIDSLRGYPSIYEVPGSDISIAEIQTDASQSTGGVGASIITVQTIEPHGYNVGQPFKVTGLLESVSGSSRAEGTFIVNSVLSSTVFTYYAKGKVGTSNPIESLLTTYIQLRKGGFYTGAAIGSPTYSLLSYVASGSFTSKFVTSSNSNRIAFTGVNSPVVGSAVTANGIPPGTQVTGITTNAATATISSDVIVPSNILQVVSTTGINVGSALDDGTGNSTFVTDITGTTLTLSAPYLANNLSLGSVVNFFPSVTLSDTTTAPIPNLTSIAHSSIPRFQVTFANAHGLVPGDTITSTITSVGTGHSLASGPFIIDSVPTVNSIVFNGRTLGSVTAAGIAGTVFARSDCFYVHRPFDGGVQLGAGSPAHGAQAVRQSKKYIRYQSGKGVMYTTGALFAPSYDIRSVSAESTSIGSVITVTTDDTEHGVQVGAEIILSNIETPGYNGHYIVNSIINENSLTVLAVNPLQTTSPILGRPPTLSLYKWKGATVRAGAFDDQNGIFWQYDGINLAVGLRSATFQLAGTVSATPDSNLVTGVNTRFTDQLVIGDRIVIKGMTHVVSTIIGNNAITVTPDYRGTISISGSKATLVQDTIIPQSQWNIDTADGTGSSGYEIEINKMQMIGFQYTWYGAGFIDWMLRGPNGDYLFVHRLKNNNKNTEAYMRSGNLPVRYEVINEGPKSKLASSINSTQTTLDLVDASLYPSAGTIYLDNELINYTQKTGNTLTGITRSASFGNFISGSFRTYSAGPAASHISNTGAILLSNTATPVISHWGSAFLTDGLFDSDRGYIFNYPFIGGTISTTKVTTFMIRLAPSVSNAITGDLGVRDLINRAQLLLKSLEFTPTGGATSQAVVIEGILNPSNYPTNPAAVQWFSLTSQGAGGQPSFAQIANATSVTWEGGAQTINATTTLVQNYFTQYQVFNKTDVANVRVGFLVSGTGVPGGTRVINIFQYDATRNYVQFSNSVNSGSGGTAYVFTSNTVSAAPGETVFSFVGSAVDKSIIDLNDLKELNNTPIGGRGTFPNGPDVLAINVYLTTGANITGNLVLRWSEAQA